MKKDDTLVGIVRKVLWRNDYLDQTPGFQAPLILEC